MDFRVTALTSRQKQVWDTLLELRSQSRSKSVKVMELREQVHMQPRNLNAVLDAFRDMGLITRTVEQVRVLPYRKS